MPRGSKYPTLEASGPQTIPLMVFGTRVLHYWVLGPSGMGLDVVAASNMNHSSFAHHIGNQAMIFWVLRPP